MNILLIHQYFLEKNDAGGMRWNEMTRLWAEKGHHITVIAGTTHYATGRKHAKYRNKYVYEEPATGNVRVIRTHVSEKYNVSYKGRMRAYLSFVFSATYAGITRARGKYDILIVSSPPLFVGIPAFILSGLKHIPFLFEVRDLWPESAIETGVIKNKLSISLAYRFEKMMYRHALRINVLTPAFRDTLVHRKNVNREKILLIPNAADFVMTDRVEKHFDRETFRLKEGLRGLVCVYVGAHGIANDLGQLLEAAERLQEEDVQFLLIGDGMQKPMLESICVTKGLHNVLFRDPMPKEEVLQFILAADIGVSALKRTEAFKTVYSNKTFDYMACRKPVLMVIDGISRELVENAGAGIFAQPGDPGDIADKVRIYLANPELVQSQGLQGYRYAREHFDRRRLADMYLDALLAMQEEKRQARIKEKKSRAL